MTARATRLALALTLSVGALVGLPALAFADNSGADPRPTASAQERHARVLPGRATGRGALRALGGNLARVARSNHLSSARLSTILRDDDTAWLTSEGRLFYQEEAPPETSVTSAATVAPAYAADQTWSLHSNPKASRKIFLDFDGATVQDTAWNRTGEGQITNGTHIGYDTDGNPKTFSSTELGFVQEVWRQVSESYAPFDVDVTTADPGVDGINRASTSDATYGVRVVVTSSPTPRTQVCGGCLGVAFVGTFGVPSATGYYQPAWVFAYSKSFDPMIVAQAATHETGHTLGLQHDGVGSLDYYGGTSAWGPIMGSSMNRAVSQFSLGEYADATNHEDDLAIISSNNRLPLRADDHGSSVLDADALGAKPSYDVNGIIGTRTDKDVFAITLPCVTDLTVSATGIGAQTALDLKLEILDGAGTVLRSNAPSSTWSGRVPVSAGMNAQASISSATGVYFVRVDGVGNGSASGAGWSDYGSLGQYRLTTSGCPAVPTLPLPSPSVPSIPTPTPSASATPTPSPSSAPEPSGPPAPSDPATPTAKPPAATRPGPPVTRTGSSGTKGGRVTAVARWAAPRSTGGAAITKYRVRAQKLDSRNHVTRTYLSAYLSRSARAVTLRLAKGRYVFSVKAYNRVGASAWSRSLRGVYAR